MRTLLTTFPYPWAYREAQQLHTTLTQLYPTGPQAVAVASRAGLSPALIFTEQSAYAVWTDILTEAAKQGLLRSLVQQAHDLLAAGSPRRPFLASLLADIPVALAAEPDSVGGAGFFLYASDAVSEPEALLYYDDLTISSAQLPALITTLGKLVALAPAVCRLLVTFEDASQCYGTGFRIGPTLLLTNWHVLYQPGTRTRAVTVMAEFGYEDPRVLRWPVRP